MAMRPELMDEPDGENAETDNDSANVISKLILSRAYEKTPFSKFKWVVIGLLSLIPTVITVVLALAANAAYEGGFNPFVVFQSSQQAPLGNIRSASIPLLSDLPSLILAATSISSLITFAISRRIRYTLQADLSKSRLLNDPNAADAAFSRMKDDTPFVNRIRIFGIALCFGLGWFFYYTIRKDSYLFHRLEALSSGRFTASAWADGWWVNQNTVLAVVWIALGSVGLYAGVAQSADYLRITGLFSELREQKLLSYTPLWISQSHGWDSAVQLVDLKVVGLVTFLVTYGPVFYLTTGVNVYIVVFVFLSFLVFLGITYSQVKTIRQIPDFHRQLVQEETKRTVAVYKADLATVASWSRHADPQQAWLAQRMAQLQLDVTLSELAQARGAKIFAVGKSARIVGAAIVLLYIVSAIIAIANEL